MLGKTTSLITTIQFVLIYVTLQGFRNEPSGILGSITRLDADWYLQKAFMLLMMVFTPDAVIHLGMTKLCHFFVS